MNLHDVTDPAVSAQHPFITFLHALDSGPDALFNIECYTDVAKGAAKPKPDPLLARYAGLKIEEVAQLIPELKQLNERGAGIFTTVNRCIGHRSINNPSIIVTSSDPTKLHLYWLLDEGSAKEKDAVGQLNRLLAYDYGADKAATDVARILRLPGFRHMKYRHLGQTPTVTATYNDRVYSLSEVQAAFPPTEPSPAVQANLVNIRH